MLKKTLDYIRFGLILLPIFFAAVDIYVSFNSVYSISLAKYVKLSSDQALRWMLVCLMFFVVSFSTCQFFSVKWFNGSSSSRIFNKNSIDSINRILKIFFLATCLYKILDILNFGIIEFFVMARASQTPVGFALYFVLMMFPFVLAHELAERGLTWSNCFSLATLFFLNLVTGFRFLLIYGLAIIILFNWSSVVTIARYKVVLLLMTFLFLLGGYEVARHNLAAGSMVYEVPSVIDRLNRTSPINNLQLIASKGVSHSLIDIIKLWGLPLPSVLEAIGLNFDGLIETKFNLNEISEPIYSEYLAWRGTPTYAATGFSMSIISYSFLFQQELGVFIFAAFYGFFIAVGCNLLGSVVYERKITGTTILVACFLCNESIVEASSLLVFGSFFLLFLFFLILLRRTIIKRQNSRLSISRPVLSSLPQQPSQEL